MNTEIDIYCPNAPLAQNTLLSYKTSSWSCCRACAPERVVHARANFSIAMRHILRGGPIAWPSRFPSLSLKLLLLVPPEISCVYEMPVATVKDFTARIFVASADIH
ncbi:hypothetical protein TNCV_4781261 [Trichonephila clavipes]|nr:hypothetical protein TNCV_4781261 [Trichonephila clavipes]